MRYININEEKELNKNCGISEYINTIVLLLNSGILIGILFFCADFYRTANTLETLDIDKINNVVNTLSNTTAIYPYFYNFGKIIEWTCEKIPDINCSSNYIIN